MDLPACAGLGGPLDVASPSRPLAVDPLAQHSMLRPGPAAAAFFSGPRPQDSDRRRCCFHNRIRRLTFTGHRRQSNPARSISGAPVASTGWIGPASSSVNSLQPPTSSKPVSWESIRMVIWALGCVGGAVRLVRLQLQLSRLRKTCRPVGPSALARQIQNRLNVRREVEVQISDAVTSPFVCGLLKPAIILPRMLAQHLSPGEVSALLSHEMAHLRRHDLAWCVAWRWTKASAGFIRRVAGSCRPQPRL